MPSAQASTENQIRILDAARTIILDQGIEALSVRKLAARSGLALKTIYNQYGNKTNVLVALFEQGTRGMDTAMDRLESAMAESRWETGFFLDWLNQVEPLFLENPEVIKPGVLAGFSGIQTKSANTLHQKRIRRMRTALGLAARKDLIRDDLDLDVTARLLYTNYFAAVTAWAKGGLDDRELIVHTRYAVLTILHTLIHAADRRENCLNLLRALKEET